MRKQPLFSVLIANYNNGKYLMDAIESVRQQTYTNWEIILVDDASTDNSKELYQELEKDQRTHIYFNEHNMGCGYTKRRCAELAKGEICGFLDADDALTQDALAEMVKAHLANPDVGLVYSRHYKTDESLQISGISQEQRVIPEGSSLLKLGGYAVSHFVSFKKSAYLKTEGINPRCKRAVDHDLYYKLEEVTSFLFINLPLYYHRIGTGNNISLDDNETKAFLWELSVEKDAAIRRGLKLEDILPPRFEAYTDDLIKETERVTADRIRRTKAYRLGAIMRAPITFIRSFFSKCNH